jgi:hypothetical protein
VERDTLPWDSDKVSECYPVRLASLNGVTQTELDMVQHTDPFLEKLEYRVQEIAATDGSWKMLPRRNLDVRGATGQRPARPETSSIIPHTWAWL